MRTALADSARGFNPSLLNRHSAATEPMNGQHGYPTSSVNPPGPQIKEWQMSFQEDRRNRFVWKLVTALFPSPDPTVMPDRLIKDFISYARKMEREMFQFARDKDEYFDFMAQRIYKIRKEYQERKNRRLEQLRNEGHVNPRFMQSHPGQQPSMLPPTSMQMPSATQPNPPQVKMEVESESEKVPEPSQSLLEPPKPVKMEVDPPAASKPIENPVIFDYESLRSDLLSVWRIVDAAEEALPFRTPVDCELLQIHDYYDIIKNPMDLNTVRQKLDDWKYKDPREFCADMWQIFENAWFYNRKVSKVYKYCTRLSEIFVENMDPLMEKLGYCCSQKRTFTPLALFCFGQSSCTIARDQAYYMYESSSTTYGVTVAEKYVYCVKCFEALPAEGLNLNENPTDPPNYVPKEKFTFLKNNEIDAEPFEKCKICTRDWHTICANFNKKVFNEGFICPTCRKEKELPKPENRFTAKKLPHCHLSRYIETHVNDFMKSKLDDSTQYNEVVIRVLSVVDKEVEVKPLMRASYAAQGCPEKYPYRTKAIFAFQVIDDVEVCFFGLHVQEYGSECPKPNARRVYIAYVDSVFFFQPRKLRTDVYHEILLAYLKYVRDLGYVMAHLWACPPTEGDDYIFHCHPPEQKIPKPKRLQDWYKTMLEKGITQDIVVEYKDILKQAKDDGLASPLGLPYFEGDYWPNIIEECIRDAKKEENKRRLAEGDDDDDDADAGDGAKTNSKNGKSKSAKKKSQSKSKNKKTAACGVTEKLFRHLDNHKETFFTIRLIQPAEELKIIANKIKDPDTLMSCELMEGRDNFLTRARDEHWEFSSLRRARYSTLCLCLALHTSDDKDVSYTCNLCNSNANWHCPICDDFDLCEKCMRTRDHEHKMEKIQLIGDKNSETNAREEACQRYIQGLTHSYYCKDVNCRKSICVRMKKRTEHFKSCKNRQACSLCKQILQLCCVHAKKCQLQHCNVPLCHTIRQKFAEQRRHQTRRAEKMMRRRMEHHGQSFAAVGSPPVSVPSPAGANGVKQMPVAHSPLESKPMYGGKPVASPAFGGYMSAPNSVPRSQGPPLSQSVPLQGPSSVQMQQQRPSDYGKQMQSPQDMQRWSSSEPSQQVRQSQQLQQQMHQQQLQQQQQLQMSQNQAQYSGQMGRPEVAQPSGDQQMMNPQLRKQLMQQQQQKFMTQQQQQMASQQQMPPTQQMASQPPSVPPQQLPVPVQQQERDRQLQMQMMQRQQQYQQMQQQQQSRPQMPSQQQPTQMQMQHQQLPQRPPQQLQQQLQQRSQMQQQMGGMAPQQVQQQRMMAMQQQRQSFMEQQQGFSKPQQQQFAQQQQLVQQQQQLRSQPPPYGMQQQHQPQQQQNPNMWQQNRTLGQGGQHMPQQSNMTHYNARPGVPAGHSSMMPVQQQTDPQGGRMPSQMPPGAQKPYGDLTQQLHVVVNRMRSARTPEEKQFILQELKKQPRLCQAYVRLVNHQQQQQRQPNPPLY